MEIRTETVYVARMTRLEAARTLVDPKELLQALRARLSSNGSEDEIIEGQAVTRALPAGETKPSTHVKRAMKKLGTALTTSISSNWGPTYATRWMARGSMKSTWRLFRPTWLRSSSAA